MNTFILAGGFATRLRPISDHVPKALVPVLGKPFLRYQLEFLKSQDITKIVLLLGHQADKIITEFGNGKKMGLMIQYQVESAPLGTGGALIQARRHLEDLTLILNGDTYFEFDLRLFYEFHKMKKSKFTIGVIQNTPSPLPLPKGEGKGEGSSKDFGAISLNSEGRVTSFIEKNRGQYLSAGCYLMSSTLLKQYPSVDGPSSLEYDLIPSWLRQGAQIYGFEFSSKVFYDIGTPERLKIFEDFISQKKTYAH